MPRGVLYVESRPASPDRADEYNEWYTGTHLGDVMSLDGFLSARRFAPVDDDGPYVAIYEIEFDDLRDAVTALSEAYASGNLVLSDAMQMDPVPSIRLLELTATFPPATDA